MVESHAACTDRVASCGYSDTVVVRDLQGTKHFTFRQGDENQPAGSTGAVSFSDDGKLLAYHVDKTVLVRAMDADPATGGHAGRVVARFDDVDAVPVATGAFSPGRADMLLCLEGVLGPDKVGRLTVGSVLLPQLIVHFVQPDDTHQIIVLNLRTQKRMIWDQCLRPVSLSHSFVEALPGSLTI